MHILLLTQVVPYPPDSGPKIKTLNVLRYLTRRHTVHLVSFARSEAEVANARALSDLCSGVTCVPLRRSRVRDVAFLGQSLLSRRPFLIERDDRRAMRRTLADLVRAETFDAVHADQISMAQFALDLPLPMRVLDEHNAVWTIVRRSSERAAWPLRTLAGFEWHKMHTYEGSVCRQFDHVTVVSDDDRRALEQAAGGSIPSTTIPIAIDTEALPFVARSPHAVHVLSMATMFYPPNVEGVLWFAGDAFPQVRAAVPATRFSIVGSRPPDSVVRLAKAESGIVVTGYVPDVNPLLAESAVLVVPVLSGSGMRVKILEAFARGIPVVSTTVGVEGIDAQPDVHLLVADTPDAFSSAVIRVLREPDMAARMARAARRLVETRYDWRLALSGLDEIYSVA
jgi:glycosyltransferase involved in cell wall biosynthesis